MSFARGVNERIGRYVTGYPSDRIKDMMARVERIEFQDCSDPDVVMKYVKWSEFLGPFRNCEIVLVTKAL